MSLVLRELVSGSMLHITEVLTTSCKFRSSVFLILF
jgi:hypothetical protein